MRSRYRVHDPHAAHFVTSTIVEWIPLFASSARCDLLVDTFKFCQQHKGLKIHGWVIMPHHFHAIFSAPDLSGVVADIRKFAARSILQQLEETHSEWLLKQFRFLKAGHKQGSHQVWQEGFHPQAIIGDEMMLQKLDYLHNNPVRSGLVVSPEHWRYSSAHEWMPGGFPLLRCDDWR